MTETKLIGRWVFEPTGERRATKRGEFGVNVTGDLVTIDNDGPTSQMYDVLRLIERPREVTRPSREAVELAKEVDYVHARFTATHPLPLERCEHRQCKLAADILSAEAAFADGPADPTPEQDAEFVRELGQMAQKPDGTLSFQEACELALRHPGEWAAERGDFSALGYQDDMLCYGCESRGQMPHQIPLTRTTETDLRARWTPLIKETP